MLTGEALCFAELASASGIKRVYTRALVCDFTMIPGWERRRQPRTNCGGDRVLDRP